MVLSFAKAGLPDNWVLPETDSVHIIPPRAAKAPTVYNAAAMNLSRTARLLLAIGSGVALALAFPLYNLPILGWIAPALLIVAVVNETPRFALLLGWLQGAVYYGLSVPWFYTVMRQYGPLPVVQAGAVFALVVFATALFHAAFALRGCMGWPVQRVARAASPRRSFGYRWNSE